jgi:hypothetical protein
MMEANMKRHTAFRAVLLVLVWLTPGMAHVSATYAAPEISATRLEQNPLITVDTSASLGGNVNGPAVIRVPDWVDRPLGRYYM